MDCAFEAILHILLKMFEISRSLRNMGSNASEKTEFSTVKVVFFQNTRTWAYIRVDMLAQQA